MFVFFITCYMDISISCFFFPSYQYYLYSEICAVALWLRNLSCPHDINGEYRPDPDPDPVDMATIYRR
ncbi:hypothetical protein VNO78_09991 [Psophocarpus tetragonolobus]|uniref:Uncharacterized protein n=1 Tax=Psophocarpus tetragonolobus TaxID=3891 RepID=A0AAN9SQK2_PSOTE